MNLKTDDALRKCSNREIYRDCKDLTGVIVVTCDKTSWLLPTFMECFMRVWPNCPYHVELLYNGESVSTELAYHPERLPDVPDRGFSGNLLHYASNEQCTPWDLSIILLDDYFLVDVDPELIDTAVCLCGVDGVEYVRLLPCPGPEQQWDPGLPFGTLSPKAPYAVSFQAAIWTPYMLRHVLKPDENPWEAEVNGTKRLRNVPINGSMCGATKNLMSYENFLRRGKVQPKVVEWLENKAITVPKERK